MQNNEIIFEKLSHEIGLGDMMTVAYSISLLYDIKFHATKDKDSLEEYDYERQWWMDKYKELNK